MLSVPMGGVFVAALMVTTGLAKLITTEYSENSLLARQGVASYEPIPPSFLEGFQVRSSGAFVTARRHGRRGSMRRDFALRDNEAFYWGANGNPLANLTTYADGDDVKVLSLERFIHVLNTAKCGTNTIDLKFTEEVQFDEVKDAWHWVNDAMENYIIFITQSAQCNVADGDNSARQPWHVISADFDDESNVVRLHAEQKTWGEAFSNWHLRVSSKGILPAEHQRRLLARNAVGKRISLDFDTSIPIGFPFSGTGLTIKDDSKSLSLNCSSCRTRGALEFDIDVTPKLSWHPGLDGYVKLGAKGVGVTLEVTVTAATEGESLPFGKDLFSIPLPSSVKIPGVMNLGPQLKFAMNGTFGKATSKIQVITGLELGIPDDAIYYHSFDDSSDDQMANWTPELTPLKPAFKGGSFSAGLSSDVKLILTGSAMGITTEIGVTLAAPSLNFNAATSKTCGKKKNRSGYSFDVTAGFGVNAYQVAKAELLGKKIEAGATQSIYSFSTPLVSTCLALPTAARHARGAAMVTTSSRLVQTTRAPTLF